MHNIVIYAYCGHHYTNICMSINAVLIFTVVVHGNASNWKFCFRIVRKGYFWNPYYSLYISKIWMVLLQLKYTDHLPRLQEIALQGMLYTRPEAVERCLVSPPQGTLQSFHRFIHMPTKTHTYSSGETVFNKQL